MRPEWEFQPFTPSQYNGPMIQRPADIVRTFPVSNVFPPELQSWNY
jgi:hypothetical protein